MLVGPLRATSVSVVEVRPSLVVSPALLPPGRPCGQGGGHVWAGQPGLPLLHPYVA